MAEQGSDSAVEVEAPLPSRAPRPSARIQPTSVTPSLGTRLIRMAFWVWALGAGVSLALLLVGLVRPKKEIKPSATTAPTTAIIICRAARGSMAGSTCLVI